MEQKKSLKDNALKVARNLIKNWRKKHSWDQGYEYLNEMIAKALLDYRNEGIREFVQRVEAQAEINMLKTGKLEGAHYAAMKKELETIRKLKESR